MTRLVRFLPILAVMLFLAVNQGYSQCNEPSPPGTGPQGCQNAPLFCSEAEFDGFCSSTENTGVGICPGPFCGSCENYHWMSFIANSTTIQLEIIPSNCQGAGMGSGVQAQMYQTSNCTNFTAVSNCESPGVQQIITVTANNLVVGQVYYLMIDGWAGDNCDYEINVLQGIGAVPPPVIPGGITGPTQVCPGAEVTYSVPAAFGATEYTWTITPGIGAVTSNQGTNQVGVTWTGPGAAQLCVTPSNACETGPPVCTTIVSTPIPPSFEFVTFCLGDIITCQGQQIQLPGQYQVVYDSWLGCDSIVTCIATAIPPVVTPPQQQTVCAPDCVTFAGSTYCETGGYTATLQSWQGCDSIVTLILASLEADAVIAPPPVLGCGASSVVLDGSQSTSVPAASNAVITYQWTGPGIVGPANANTVTVNATGTYTLTVTQSYNGVVCTDMASVTVIQDTAVPNQPNLNGLLGPCQNTTATYTATPVGTPAPTGYTWTVTGGTFVNNGNTIDVTWTTSGAGQVCVTADNACGSSTQNCININVGQAPALPVLNGPDTVCEGDEIIYEINPLDPATTSYTWTVTGGATFTDLGSSIEVDFSGAGSGQVCVIANNACNMSGQVCIDVTVDDVPAQAAITGDDNLCASETGTYSVPADPNASNYNWTIPASASITAGQGTNSISVDWTGSTGGNVCVTLENGCGLSPQTCFPVVVNSAPTAAISGTGDFCTGSGDMVNLTITLTGTGPWDLVYAIDAVNQPAIQINSSPFTLMTGTAGAYTIVSVTDQTPCPGSVSGTGTVVENPLPTASISGDLAICQGSGDCVDFTVNLTGTPNWSLVVAINGNPQAPITGITTSPYLYEACQGGTYTIVSVTDGNGCTDAGTGSATVTVNTAPIVSNITRPCDPTNTSYVVMFEISGGDPASYTVNGSTAGISAGPPYIFTSNPIANGAPYSFIVDDANGCNPVMVDGSKTCDCTTSVGTMDQTPQSACGTDCITAVYDPTGEMFDGDDVIEYVLHTGSGLTIVNEIARNNIPEFCFDALAGMTYGATYYISAVVGNDQGGGTVDLGDPCLAVAQGSPAVFYETPTGTLSGDATVCAGESADLSIAFTGAAPWNITYDDGNGPITLNGINSNPYTLTVTPAATTTYTLIDVSNNNCPGTSSGTATVTVNNAPTVSNVGDACNATSTAYTVTFEINGGDPGTYQVLPAGSGAITPGTPAIFTSNEVPAGTTYTFQVTDGNACDTVTVTGMVICDCTTDVGTMDLNAIDECGDGPVTASYDPTNEALDGDDVVEYILHNGSANAIGYPIIARNSSPTFSFDGLTMSYGTTYYISAIVGNNDGSGSVDDLNDPCLAVAAGTPVTFYEVPTVNLTGTTDICLGESATLNLAFTGDAPWSVIINDGLSDTPLNNINSVSFNYMVTPTATTTYTITQMNDENCPGPISGTATVTVNVAPVATAPDITFNANNTGYTVCFVVSGGEPPYMVSDGVNTVMTDSLFCSAELPCGSGFSFMVDDGNGCGPVIVEQAVVTCDCITQVGDVIDPGSPIEICGPGPVSLTYDNTNEMLDGNDVVDFILHNGNFVPILTNTTAPTFSYSPALMYGTTYFISARAGDNNGSGNVSAMDPCLSTTPGIPVVFYQIPSGLLSGGGDICIGECIDLSLTITGGVAPWTVTYANSLGDTITEVVNSSPAVLTVCPSNTTLYSLVSLEDANCAATNLSGAATVTLQGVPFGANVQVTIDPTNTFATICFDIIGGDVDSYVVTGDPGTVTGESFCSDPIPCGQGSYFFLVQDGFQCITDTVQGPIVCNCISNAGIMTTNLVSVCENEDVSSTPPVGSALDGNDVLIYALHTNNGPALGTIIATNSTPDFSYDPALINCGQSYFISSVVGDDDGTGSVDLSDDCLSVAVGTPVVWYCLPTADIAGTATICEGGSTDLVFDLSGEGPFNLVVNDGTTDFDILDIDDADPYPVTPGATTTYTLVSVFDITTGCFNTASGSVTVTVNSPVTAGTASAAMEFCADETNVVSLAGEITGADPGGIWTETSAVPSTGGAFNAGAGTFNTNGQQAGTYTFLYTVVGAAPCPNDTETVTVVINPQPVADAGTEQEINCDETEATIGGSNTSQGPNFSYEWTDALSAVVGTDPTLTVSGEGVYTLQVTNTVTGCTAVDQVAVTESIGVPEASITVVDVSCFGDDDGFIIVDAIDGGVPPYLCSFEGSAFSSQKQFTNLAAGTYELVIEDSKGCETVVTLTVNQPDELTVELIGDFATTEDIVELGDSVQLSVQLNIPFGEVDSIVWSPASLINCDTCQSNFVTPGITTTFSVWVEDEGCFDEAELRVQVKKTRPVYIPNVFSPNGDGENDVFFIQAGPSVVEIKSFLVFNRWGESVFEINNVPPNSESFGWNGTFRGEILNPGAFAYFAEIEFIDGIVEIYKGDVVLLR